MYNMPPKQQKNKQQQQQQQQQQREKVHQEQMRLHVEQHIASSMSDSHVKQEANESLIHAAIVVALATTCATIAVKEQTQTPTSTRFTESSLTSNCNLTAIAQDVALKRLASAIDHASKAKVSDDSISAITSIVRPILSQLKADDENKHLWVVIASAQNSDHLLAMLTKIAVNHGIVSNMVFNDSMFTTLSKDLFLTMTAYVKSVTLFDKFVDLSVDSQRLDETTGKIAFTEELATAVTTATIDGKNLNTLLAAVTTAATTALKATSATTVEAATALTAATDELNDTAVKAAANCFENIGFAKIVPIQTPQQVTPAFTSKITEPTYLSSALDMNKTLVNNYVKAIVLENIDFTTQSLLTNLTSQKVKLGTTLSTVMEYSVKSISACVGVCVAKYVSAKSSSNSKVLTDVEKTTADVAAATELVAAANAKLVAAKAVAAASDAATKAAAAAKASTTPVAK